MKLVGSGLQSVRHPLYDASGTIQTGGTAQLVLARSQSRSFLMLQNLSAGTLVFEFGSARATATITNGVVTSCTVTNAGFGFTKPPVIEFLGGGFAGNSSYLGLNQPNGESPNSAGGRKGRPAKAHAVLTAGAVSSIVIDDGGADYAIAPYVFIYNSDLDPYGAAAPTATPGAGSLSLATATPPFILNGTACTTDQISVIGASSTAAYMCRWMD